MNHKLDRNPLPLLILLSSASHSEILENKHLLAAVSHGHFSVMDCAESNGLPSDREWRKALLCLSDAQIHHT